MFRYSADGRREHRIWCPWSFSTPHSSHRATPKFICYFFLPFPSLCLVVYLSVYLSRHRLRSMCSRRDGRLSRALRSRYGYFTPGRGSSGSEACVICRCREKRVLRQGAQVGRHAARIPDDIAVAGVRHPVRHDALQGRFQCRSRLRVLTPRGS